MKFEYKEPTASSKEWFGTTVAPTFQITPLEACHAVMLSSHDATPGLTRAELDKAVRDELLEHGKTRLQHFAEVVDGQDEDKLQIRWDWARVELLKNWPELHGKLPALFE